MRPRQAVIVGGSMTGMLLLGAGPAFAAYQPTIGTGIVSKSHLKQGQAVAFCGAGYAPKTVVYISVGGRYYEKVLTNAHGSFCAALKPQALGRQTLAARGTGENTAARTLVALVIIVERHHPHDPAANPASLPGSGGALGAVQLVSASASGTGVNSGTPLTAAETAVLVSGSLLLLGAGAGFRVAGRRRRSPVD
jgi:hypothetical protein